MERKAANDSHLAEGSDHQIFVPNL